MRQGLSFSRARLYRSPCDRKGSIRAGDGTLPGHNCPQVGLDFIGVILDSFGIPGLLVYIDISDLVNYPLDSSGTYYRVN